MPLLQDLVQELQQRLSDQAPAPTSAEVADAASSERINVTLPRGVMDQLKHTWRKVGAAEIWRPI